MPPRRRKNPPLVIFGMNPKSKYAIESETNAWQNMLFKLNYAIESIEYEQPNEIIRQLKSALVICEKMLQQVFRGIHKNPSHLTNPSQKKRIGSDVQAVIYRHVDGTNRVHGFGNADIELRDLPNGGVQVSRMHERTGVTMYGYPDGTVTLCGPAGEAVWGMESDV